ncbi:hypothetical protein ABHQ57_14650 [Tenacibaculum sp. ZH5_bin.1]|uniref:hypothetical protein n=1 Tax=unclassified Tenacibaculum TaxID=2635139 RepID=UPI0036E621E1
MPTNFDRTFEKNNIKFKNKFGVDWNKEPQLYLTYIQSIYLSALHDVANNGLGQVLSQQRDTHQLLLHVSQKIDK